MKNYSQRSLYFMGFIITIVLLGISFYLQQFDGLVPCPLCILQRITLGFLGILFLLGSILPLKKTGHTLLGIFSSFIALLGIFLSGRQVWLQHLPPDTMADCGASLQYLIHVLPFDQIISQILKGTSECARNTGEFILMSLAEWSLLGFSGFFLFCLFLIKRIKK